VKAERRHTGAHDGREGTFWQHGELLIVRELAPWVCSARTSTPTPAVPPAAR
jgi:hypothetical protein